MGRTTINLAPADVKKEGPSFDLPIAIGMLAASEQIETDQLDNFVDGRRTRADRRGPAGAKAFCRSRCARGRMAKPACSSRRKMRPKRRSSRACRSFRFKTCARPRISRRRNQNRARPRWTSRKSSTSRTTRRLDFAEVKGPGIGEARVGNRRGRRPQCPAHRPAGHRQIHAGETARHDSAAAHAGRSAGDDEDSQHRRPAAAGPGAGHARPFRAPHHTASDAGLARRQYQSDARRNFARASRRFVSGRIAGVQAQRAGNDAPAAGRRPRHHFARGGHDDLSLANSCWWRR